MCVWARGANSSTNGEEMEATIAESGNVVLESVPCKVGQDVRFGDLGASGAGFAAVGGNEETELELMRVLWDVDVVVVA